MYHQIIAIAVLRDVISLLQEALTDRKITEIFNLSEIYTHFTQTQTVTKTDGRLKMCKCLFFCNEFPNAGPFQPCFGLILVLCLILTHFGEQEALIIYC